MKKIFTIVLLALALGNITNLNATRLGAGLTYNSSHIYEFRSISGRAFLALILSTALLSPSIYVKHQLRTLDEILEYNNKTWNLGKEIWPTAHEMSDDYLHNKEGFANRMTQMAQMHMVKLKGDPQVKIPTTKYWLIHFVELAKSDLERLKTSKSKLNFKPILKKTLLFILKEEIDDKLAKIKLYKKRLLFILKVLLETEEYRVQLQRSYSDNSFVTVENV